MEANLTGAPIYASNIDDLAVAEEENLDKDITTLAKASNVMEIDLDEEHRKEAYQDTKTLILKTSTKFKIATNIIQNNGRQSTKLYNNSSLTKLTFSIDSLKTLQEQCKRSS